MSAPHAPAEAPVPEQPSVPERALAAGPTSGPEQVAVPVAQPAPPRGVLRALLRLPVHLYHAGLGFLLGHRFLLLVHTGRRTGIRRETVLEVVRYDPASRESVVAAGWGRRTGWLHNVEAGLVHEVRTGRERFVPEYRILDPSVAERIFADYERRNRLIAPIVRAVIGRLVGWPYDGTPAARRRVVEQLPLVAFRPRPTAPSTPDRKTGGDRPA